MSINFTKHLHVLHLNQKLKHLHVHLNILWTDKEYFRAYNEHAFKHISN